MGRVRRRLSGLVAAEARSRRTEAAGRRAATRRLHRRSARAKKRLSYKEQRELDAMPQTIDALEAEQRALQQRIADPAFYRQDKAAIAVGLAALDSINDKLATAYARWEQLDAGS